MSDLNKLGLAEARDALRKGDTTSVELTEACLKAIEGADALNACAWTVTALPSSPSPSTLIGRRSEPTRPCARMTSGEISVSSSSAS